MDLTTRTICSEEANLKHQMIRGCGILAGYLEIDKFTNGFGPKHILGMHSTSKPIQTNPSKGYLITCLHSTT